LDTEEADEHLIKADKFGGNVHLLGEPQKNRKSAVILPYLIFPRPNALFWIMNRHAGNSRV